MKRVKWKQRFLIIGMAIAMLVNGIPLYAAEQSDNIPIVDDCAVPESNMLPDEIITEGNEFIAEETEDEDLEISSEIEDNVEELNAQYDLSVSITEVTWDTVKGVVNISQCFMPFTV